jgi:hypothetical protein
VAISSLSRKPFHQIASSTQSSKAFAKANLRDARANATTVPEEEYNKHAQFYDDDSDNEWKDLDKILC